MAFIATQNDKMQTAVEAFDDIINNMPESEAAFSVAKDRILAQLRTDRVTGIDVLYEYRNCRTLGLREPLSREIFEGVQEMSLEDVAAAQEKWVKGRDYTYAILGDVADLDHNRLSRALKNWKLDIVGHVGYERCVITAGGVSLDEINQKTLETKKVPGLYLAGEILDLDADTGGYNLHIAFSTGYLAGISAARQNPKIS